MCHVTQLKMDVLPNCYPMSMSSFIKFLMLFVPYYFSYQVCWSAMEFYSLLKKKKYITWEGYHVIDLSLQALSMAANYIF